MEESIKLTGMTGRLPVKLSTILVAFFIASLQLHVSNGQICGIAVNGAVCSDGTCCSSYGYCGTSYLYCGTGCQSLCTNVSGSGQCGSTANNALCNNTGDCCSSFGYCGTGSPYCGSGCQSGPCTGFAPSSGPSSGPSSSKSGGGVGVYVGIAVAVIVAVILVLVALFCCVRRRRKRGSRTGMEEPDEENGLPHFGTDEYISQRPLQGRGIGGIGSGVRFSYTVLHDATEGFKEELGRGAFGVVYKGTLRDETGIAVKKLLDNDRGLKDFEAEVKTLGSINHANLVALFGYCVERNQPFLVYEYVSRGSLDQWIFRKDKGEKEFVLPWKTRFEIMRGTAKGLAYLHEDLQIGQAIIHLDIKPENILLDDLFVPKVADFGMAKLLGAKKTHTLAAGGTVGYMAPEVHVGAASSKMDVYSFGSVLLEVVSGRRLLDASQPEGAFYLPAWAIRKIIEGEEVDVIDPLLPRDQFDLEEAKRLILVALLCIQRDPDDRPGMSTVLRMIEGIIVPHDLPSSMKNELEMNERVVSVKKLTNPESGTTDVTSSGPRLIDFSSTSEERSKDRESSREHASESRPLFFSS